MTLAGTVSDSGELLAAGAVVVARPDLSVLPLRGADVLSYLHKVCSQHTADLRPGDGTRALLLSPKGRIDFAFRLGVGEQVVWLDTAAGAAQGLADRLARFVFRYDVAVGAPTGGVVSVVGPAAEQALARAGLPVPARGATTAAGDGFVAHRARLGVDLAGTSVEEAAGRLRSAGTGEAPLSLWDLLRVEQGLPRQGLELTDDVLAEEAGLLGSHVHLDKGCYPGQETVARVHNLGQVQRRLAGLHVAGDPPAFRTELRSADGRRAGEVRSSLSHSVLGTIALAYVRRFVPTGSVVLAGAAEAQVVGLPFRELWASDPAPASR